ncbi:hypothetical protein ACIPIL_00430 [Serratia nematodiphila]
MDLLTYCKIIKNMSPGLFGIPKRIPMQKSKTDLEGDSRIWHYQLAPFIPCFFDELHIRFEARHVADFNHRHIELLKPCRKAERRVAELLAYVVGFIGINYQTPSEFAAA